MDVSNLCRIREARAEDVPLLQAIEWDAAQSYAAYAETRFCLDLSARSDSEHRIARERGFALVADLAGVPAGFVLVVPKDGRAHILEIAVVRAKQKRGYGRQLMAAAEAWAVAAGFSEITLTTFRDVSWNAPFYAKLGFSAFDVGPDRSELAELIAEEIELGVHAAPRVAMRKSLVCQYRKCPAPDAIRLIKGRSGDDVSVRRAVRSDWSNLVEAIVELQNYERQLHETRLPGEQIADVYAHEMLGKAEGSGLVLVAEGGEKFVGFAAAWIEQEDNVAETPDSNRFGYVSDICVLPQYRGQRIAKLLLEAVIAHFRLAGITRVRIGVLAKNRSARKAYEHVGFDPYEVVYERAIS